MLIYLMRHFMPFLAVVSPFLLCCAQKFHLPPSVPDADQSTETENSEDLLASCSTVGYSSDVLDF